WFSFTLSIIYFFFQAEDGIRDRNVTGVQTCALPIYLLVGHQSPPLNSFLHSLNLFLYSSIHLLSSLYYKTLSNHLHIYLCFQIGLRLEKGLIRLFYQL